MKYLIDDKVVEESKFYERLEEEVNFYVEFHYDEILDECYPEVKIGSLTFSASLVLAKCDRIAYNCGVSDEQSFKLDEAKSDLESGEEVELNGVTFRIEEEEEE